MIKIVSTCCFVIATVLLVGVTDSCIYGADETGFEVIFDGKTLKGWDGDPAIWRVEDGCITGETTAAKPLKANTFIIWRGGELRDFELKCEYKIVGGSTGNSGIQYRSFELPDRKWGIGGYQADLEAGDKYSGILYGENFRGILGERGQKTVIRADHKPEVVGSVGDSQEIGKSIRKEDWNEYHITARGFHFVQKINGVVTVEVTDEDEQMRRAAGLLALQAHVGPPMKVQFRNIRLKTLRPSGSNQSWIEYPAREGTGAGAGKRVVLISGDEEYRSEDMLPQLGKILSQRHGFSCRVVFAIDPKTGEINPGQRDNIPGLEALNEADLMVIFTRFRNLPVDQMRSIEKYVMAGKPVVGIRTATHAFEIPEGPYAHWSWRFSSPEKKSLESGFGRIVLGETWISHHGKHGHESTRGVPVVGQENHPILRGVRDVWAATDVYGVRLPLPDRCTALLLGQVLQGMDPSAPPVEGARNNPAMPVAWTQEYQFPDGLPGRAFTTTMGAPQDFANAGFRRLLVNACYWAVQLEDKIDAQANIDFIGSFVPTKFAFGGHRPHVLPVDHQL